MTQYLALQDFIIHDIYGNKIHISEGTILTIEDDSPLCGFCVPNMKPFPMHRKEADDLESDKKILEM